MKSKRLISFALTEAIIISVLASAIPAYAAEEPPEKYDSRDYGYITPVRDQRSYGTCWAHGTLAACEASLVKNNGYSPDLDLAEFHLAYCTYHTKYDRLGLFDSIVDDTFLQTYMNDGGDEELAAATLANWNGPVTDSAHYSQFTSEKFWQSGLNQLDFASKQLQYCMNAAQLKDFYLVKTSNLPKMKEYIMKYGAGTISLSSAPLFRDDSKGIWFYNEETQRQMTGGHTMAVVGWDDTIPASELTVKNYTPSQDGAFIVKNSWSTSYGNEGYYYVPYEKCMLTGISLFFSFNNADTYTYNYGYDDTDNSRLFSDPDSIHTITAGNIYTATADDETLEAVSFFPTADNIDYEVSVYTGIPENAAAPDQGEFRVKLTGTADTGYRTLELPQAIQLSAGTRFSVVVKLSGGDKEQTFMQTGADRSDNADHNRGKSYVYTTSRGWHDFCDENREKMYGSARIKAFTKSPSAPVLTEPEDYEVYDNLSRELLLTQAQETSDRYRDMTSKYYWNYNQDDLGLLSCYNDIFNSISQNSDMYTASEIYATTNNYKKLLDNVKPLDPYSLLDELQYIALKITRGNNGRGLRYWQEYKDEYDRIIEMAKNKEITIENVSELRASLGDVFMPLIIHMIENGYGNSTIQKYGDINCDGVIDVLDATKLQRIVAKLEDMDYYTNMSSDLNDDLIYSISDVTLIQQKAANMIDHFAIYDYDCDVKDEYTADSSLESIKEYLRQAIEERSDWELFTPTIHQEYERVQSKVVYDHAKRMLADADNQNKAELLYYTRHLIYSVKTSPWGN